MKNLNCLVRPLRQTARGDLSMVPPSPALMIQLYARYDELVDTGMLSATISFETFFEFWSSSRRAADELGLDDGAAAVLEAATDTLVGPELIVRPRIPLRGVIRTLVLLVDFSDRPHESKHTVGYYERMLFGAPGVFPSGSMRDYYHIVSRFDAANRTGIDVQGTVLGWFRMPRPSTYYANNAAGMGAYPRSAQGMAEDAVKAAIAEDVDFPQYDNFGNSLVTALFVVHAGRGGEETGSKLDMWSLKWNIPNGIKVSGDKRVETFLTVPEDCRMGVCAHEWGHLAAQWADFYDTVSGAGQSNGLGDYCLMAGGSWGNGGITPTMPNGMLPMFHGWTEPPLIEASQANVVLRPTAEGGDSILVRNPAIMNDNQYVLVEYRRRRGQDAFLPDEGIAIYVVDEDIDDVNNERKLAIELMQADGKRDLALTLGRGNRGDAHDLYPEQANNRVGQNTTPALNLPDGTWTGITITVHGRPCDATMSVDIEI